MIPSVHAKAVRNRMAGVLVKANLVRAVKAARVVRARKALRAANPVVRENHVAKVNRAVKEIANPKANGRSSSNRVV